MVMYLNRRLVFWGGLLLLGLAVPAQAHNGALAIAVPVEGIKIDGDLSDWPEGMRRYPIALPEDGVKPKGPDDFQGNFRIGYNAEENALYVAVEIQDESVVKVAPGEVRWHTQDGCEVYVGIGHKEEDGPVLQYVIWGSTRVADPTGRKGELADVKVEVKWGERGYRYEWRIDVGKLSKGQAHLKPGMGIAFDLALWDKDKDGSATWMAWGKGTVKYGLSSRLGDVVLADAGEGALQMGRIDGKVKWADTEEGLAYGKVRIQSLASADFWVQPLADSQGVYTAELPAGKYQIEAGYRRQKTGAEVEVRKGGTTTVPEVIFPRPPLGLVVAAGEGTVVKAGRGMVTRVGAGSRQRAWNTLDGSDGIPTYINAIYQDRNGYLWLASSGGVARYDGHYLETFTAHEGLPADFVTSVLQDRDGNLWFNAMKIRF